MSSPARFACIDPRAVSIVWPLARDFIKSAVERVGVSDFELIESEVLGGDQLLWIAFADGAPPIVEAAATTQLVSASGDLVCVLVACGGRDRRRWLPFLEQIEAYAKAEGSSKMRIYGRKGWERVLEGYRSKCVVLDRDL